MKWRMKDWPMNIEAAANNLDMSDPKNTFSMVLIKLEDSDEGSCIVSVAQKDIPLFDMYDKSI